jgi:hypothetical protein
LYVVALLVDDRSCTICSIRWNGGMNTTELLASVNSEIVRFQQVRALLAGNNRSHSVQPRKKHKLSAEARERIAAAQRKRWAKQKAARKK